MARNLLRGRQSRRRERAVFWKKMDATHFFVSDLHPRVKEEDLEPSSLMLFVSSLQGTGQQESLYAVVMSFFNSVAEKVQSFLVVLINRTCIFVANDRSIDGIDVCRPGDEVSKDTDPEDPSGKTL
nr:hypothetical protein [Tanacetum cinerariifolium]